MELSFTTVMFLEFYLFYVFLGERVIGWVRAGVRNITSLSMGVGVLNIFRRFSGGGGGGAKFYGSILK
jgi:hypothetical protein